MDAEQKVELRERLRVWGPFVLLALGLFVLMWWLAEPAPPEDAIIATGSEKGAYHAAAAEYVETFADNSITLTRRTTAGSIENAQLLRNREVDAALIQGGVLPADQREDLEAVAAVFYEPLWLVRRADVKPHADSEVRSDEASGIPSTQPTDDPPEGIAALAALRVAVGAEGSGTRAIALKLLDDYGIADSVTTSEFGGTGALAALRSDTIDAAFFVIAPHAPLIDELIHDPALEIVPLRRAPGLSRTYDTLTHVTLFKGSYDLAADLPEDDLPLVAPVAMLVVHEDVHPSIVQLLVQAAVDAHTPGTLLSEPGGFPNVTKLDLPLHPDVRYHIDNGPSLLQRHLPFWVASLVDRLIIFIIPLLVLLIPLSRAAPSVYRWRIRARIYRWYRIIRQLDESLATSSEIDAHVLKRSRYRLDQLDAEILDVKVPLSYMEEFYNLRLHMAYVRSKIDERLRDPTARSVPPGSSAGEAPREERRDEGADQAK